MVDWFWSGGRVHPIRSSPGYDDALVGLSKADKDYLRDGTKNYTVTSPGRAERVLAHAEAKAKLRTRGKAVVGYRLAPEAQENQFRVKYRRTLY